MVADRSYHGGAGEAFAARVNAPGLNSLHERPAVLELIGDVGSQRIADLGCGAGNYLVELARRGAQVTGVDGSQALVAHAHMAAGVGAQVVHHDLEQPLAFLNDHSQDGVLCALVLHHLNDRPQFLKEVHRILRPGGWLVVSSTHPTADWGRFGGSYFDQRWVTRPLDDRYSIEYQLIPLSILVNELLDAGFVLDKMIEPQPSLELKQADPQRYEELRAAPIFLALRLHT
ncbi:MAG: methyltransferase domain-containing protein [Ornithinimicrobium sp.]